MESDTFVNSSPIKSEKPVSSNIYPKPKLTNYELLKSEIRSFINPNLKRSNNHVLAMPMDWFDILNKFSDLKNGNSDNIKYVKIKQDIQTFVFPKLSSNYKIINIQPVLKNDPYKGLSSWLDFYELSNNLAKCNCNKLYFIQTIIFNYLTKSEISNMPFMMILSPSKMTIFKMKLTFLKIKKKLILRNHNLHLKLNPKPLFTIQIQDQQNPYIMLWMDTENMCSFNIQNLKTIQSKVNFANALMLFINYSLTSSLTLNDKESTLNNK